MNNEYDEFASRLAELSPDRQEAVLDLVRRAPETRHLADEHVRRRWRKARTANVRRGPMKTGRYGTCSSPAYPSLRDLEAGGASRSDEFTSQQRMP